MSYLLVAGVVVVVLLWGPFMRRLLRREQWRIGSGALSIGVLAAAGFVAARGGWPEGMLLAVIALMFAVSSRWPRARPTPPPEGDMSLEAARAMLGVGPDASRADIQAAYTRLMKRVHPDHGGAAGLATQLNLARDRLLKT